MIIDSIVTAARPSIYFSNPVNLLFVVIIHDPYDEQHQEKTGSEATNTRRYHHGGVRVIEEPARWNGITQ